MRILLSSLFVLVSASAAAAQTPAARAAPQAAVPSTPHPVRGIVAPPRDSRFARLFPSPSIAVQTRDARPVDGPTREIICGTTVFRVDASRDPQMLLPTAPARTDAKIRKITPPVCSRPADPAPSDR